MRLNEFVTEIRNLKGKGDILTNTFPGCIEEDVDFTPSKRGDAYVFTVCERFRKRGFFVAIDDKKGREELIELIRDCPSDTIFEWLQKKKDPFDDEDEAYDSCDLKEVFEAAGLSLYEKYVRVMTTYVSNPFDIPEEGRRSILSEMYEPGGEYAKIEDANELFQLNIDTFDANCDDTFTLDEWKEIIRNKNCLVHRDNGKISAYYVWKLQGKKLYSNISVNFGPANHLYNMERRIFEEYWKMGIRTYYAWFNMNNKNALKRGNKNAQKCIKSKGILYNYVYKQL